MHVMLQQKHQRGAILMHCLKGPICSHTNIAIWQCAQHTTLLNVQWICDTFSKAVQAHLLPLSIAHGAACELRARAHRKVLEGVVLHDALAWGGVQGLRVCTSVLVNVWECGAHSRGGIKAQNTELQAR